MNRISRWLWVFIAIVLWASWGCSPTSYAVRDYEGYKRPGTDVYKYKRVAVLYVGGTYSSSGVQQDQGSTNKQAQEGALATSSQTESYAVDCVVCSNALLSAFSRRGVEVVERNRVNDLIREQGIVNQELTSDTDLKQLEKLGKILRADLLIKGSLFAVEGGFQSASPTNPEEFFCALRGLTLTAIDTRTGELVWIETHMLARRVAPDDLEDEGVVSNEAAIRELVEEMVARFYNDKAQKNARRRVLDGDDLEENDSEEEDEFGE